MMTKLERAELRDRRLADPGGQPEVMAFREKYRRDSPAIRNIEMDLAFAAWRTRMKIAESKLQETRQFVTRAEGVVVELGDVVPENLRACAEYLEGLAQGMRLHADTYGWEPPPKMTASLSVAKRRGRPRDMQKAVDIGLLQFLRQTNSLGLPSYGLSTDFEQWTWPELEALAGTMIDSAGKCRDKNFVVEARRKRNKSPLFISMGEAGARFLGQVRDLVQLLSTVPAGPRFSRLVAEALKSAERKSNPGKN